MIGRRRLFPRRLKIIAFILKVFLGSEGRLSILLSLVNATVPVDKVSFTQTSYCGNINLTVQDYQSARMLYCNTGRDKVALGYGSAHV